MTLLAFYALCRPGEPLRATRSQLLTSSDLLEDGLEVFLRIGLPKTRRRGATVQHVQLQGPDYIHAFVTKVLQNLDPHANLFGGSSSSYRRRWDCLLRALLIGPEHRLSPGSYEAEEQLPLTDAVKASPTSNGGFDLNTKPPWPTTCRRL